MKSFIVSCAKWELVKGNLIIDCSDHIAEFHTKSVILSRLVSIKGQYSHYLQNKNKRITYPSRILQCRMFKFVYLYITWLCYFYVQIKIRWWTLFGD